MIKIEIRDLSHSKECDAFMMPVFKGEEGSARAKDLADKKKGYLRLVNDPEIGNILLVWLGRKVDATGLFIKETFATALGHMSSIGAKRIGLICTESFLKNGGLDDSLEGMILSSYSFDKHKSAKDKAPYLYIITKTSKQKAEASKRTERTIAWASAVLKIRDHVNEPSNILTPNEMKKRASKVAQLKNVKMKVIEGRELEKERLNAIRAVGSGSKTGAKLICLEYSPAAAKRKVALIGKGVTFDTGGYSLKPPRHMLGMKGDMLGSAIVMSLIEHAANSSAKIKLMGFMPLAENMISSSAYKPEDIIRTHSGKTVEVENTDAEGRLLLADTLSYCKRYKPDEIVDVATLSGSCHLALGEFICPFVSNNESMAHRLERSSELTGEKFLRLPLMKDYLRFLKSSVADIKNISFGSGGSLITSSIFLSEFVGDSPWLHIDLAGGDFQSGSVSPIFPKGSSGFGIKTLMSYLGLI